MSIHRMSMQLMVSLEVQALQLLPLKSDARWGFLLGEDVHCFSALVSVQIMWVKTPR
jgi:hypothetical protein